MEAESNEFEVVEYMTERLKYLMSSLMPKSFMPAKNGKKLTKNIGHLKSIYKPNYFDHSCCIACFIFLPQGSVRRYNY